MKHFKLDETLASHALHAGALPGFCASCGRLRLSSQSSEARPAMDICQGCGDRFDGETTDRDSALRVVIANHLI